MVTSSKSAGTSHSSGSEAKTGNIATLPGGFLASETKARSRTDVCDDIDRRLAQLTALLESIYGGGFEAFSTLNERLRDNILWLAADLAREVQADFDSLDAHVIMAARDE